MACKTRGCVEPAAERKTPGRRGAVYCPGCRERRDLKSKAASAEKRVRTDFPAGLWDLRVAIEVLEEGGNREVVLRLLKRAEKAINSSRRTSEPD